MAELIVPNLKSVVGATGPRLIGGRGSHRSPSGSDAWCNIIFSGLLVALGLGVMLIGTRVIPINPGSVRLPYWVLTVGGAGLALISLLVWFTGWKQYGSIRRRRKALRLHPGELAYADAEWNELGYQNSRWKNAMAALGGATFALLGMSTGLWWALWTDILWEMELGFVIFLVGLMFLWMSMLKLGRAIKYSGSRIVFERFPYRVGAPLTIAWVPASGIGSAAKGTFTLRCVSEFIKSGGFGKESHSSVEHEELWGAVWSFDQECAFPAEAELPLRFEPPAGLPPTSLSAEPLFFWEFEVKLVLPGLDFEEIYLVPLYA